MPVVVAMSALLGVDRNALDSAKLLRREPTVAEESARDRDLCRDDESRAGKYLPDHVDFLKPTGRTIDRLTDKDHKTFRNGFRILSSCFRPCYFASKQSHADDGHMQRVFIILIPNLHKSPERTVNPPTFRPRSTGVFFNARSCHGEHLDRLRAAQRFFRMPPAPKTFHIFAATAAKTRSLPPRSTGHRNRRIIDPD